MVRRFCRDSAIYAIPVALSSGISFLMFPFYAHRFTPREYGAYDLLTLTGILVGWTVALEIYQGLGRFVADEKDMERVRRYASTALWFAIGVYAAFLVLVELFADPASHLLLGKGVSVVLLRVAAPWMAVQGVLQIAQSQLRWQLRPVSFAVASIIYAVFTAVASALLVFVAHLEVEGAFLGVLTGASVSLVYVLVAARGTFHLHFERQKCREMLVYSAPLVPASVAVFLNLYADRLVIQHMRSLGDVGVYGVGYRLAAVVTLLLAGFQGAALPLILARKDEPSTPADLARVFRIFTAIALSTFVVLTILATPAIRILAAAQYQRASSVVPFLLISTLFAGMYMFAAGISIAKRTVTMAKVTVVAGVGNLALVVALVGPLGIVGAGIATASTSLAWFAALMVVSQRHYPVPHRWGQLLWALGAVTLLVFVSLAVLPSDRAHALGPAYLVIRIALVALGVFLAAALSLDGAERGLAMQSVEKGLAKITARRRQAAGVT